MKLVGSILQAEFIFQSKCYFET